MYVLINKELDEKKRFKEIKVLGSIMALKEEKLTIGTKTATYRMLSSRLSSKGIIDTEKYVVKKCELITYKK